MFPSKIAFFLFDLTPEFFAFHITMSSNWNKFKAKSKSKKSKTTSKSQPIRTNKTNNNFRNKPNNKKRPRPNRDQSSTSTSTNDQQNQKTSKKNKKKKQQRQRDASSTNTSSSSTSTSSSTRILTRTLTKPPPPFRSNSSSSTTQKYFTPKDPQFNQLNKQCYRGLVFDPASAVPEQLHNNVTTALESMRRSQFFHRDVVATGRSVSATFVERTLIGNPGMTYFYQRLRIFAHSWDDQHCTSDSPLRVIRQLNNQMKILTKRHIKQDKTTVKGSYDFNITLINYMQSSVKANQSAVPLREEEKFGLGEASVSWHADSSLQDFSSIAIYHQTGNPTGSSWSVASRVIGDEITPAIKVALKDRQTYYMLNDFNHHHHHAVLAGNTWRYSSTHRVAITNKDTFEYAWQICQDGTAAYKTIVDNIRSNNEIDPIAMRKAAESHLVIEFDWLRMYVIQGKRKKKCVPKVCDLELFFLSIH